VSGELGAAVGAAEVPHATTNAVARTNQSLTSCSRRMVRLGRH
jgi:hypothetical protein